MTELWNTSALAVKEPSGLPGVFAMRVTNCSNQDTITLPVKTINSAFISNETTATGNTVSISSNTLTISCTDNDEVNILAFTER